MSNATDNATYAAERVCDEQDAYSLAHDAEQRYEAEKAYSARLEDELKHYFSSAAVGPYVEGVFRRLKMYAMEVQTAHQVLKDALSGVEQLRNERDQAKRDAVDMASGVLENDWLTTTAERLIVATADACYYDVIGRQWIVSDGVAEQIKAAADKLRQPAAQPK